MRYGPQWRAHRRVLHQSLLPGPLARYDAARLRMTRDFLRRLLESPEAFLKHCETCVPSPLGARAALCSLLPVPPR